MYECVKMTALEGELEIPLNVHHWRKLESSDPECYDLVRKAQSLQRTLIGTTESIVKKDVLIQEKVCSLRRLLVMLSACRAATTSVCDRWLRPRSTCGDAWCVYDSGRSRIPSFEVE